MLGTISAGLSHNPSLITPESVPYVLPALAEPIAELRQQTRWLRQELERGH